MSTNAEATPPGTTPEAESSRPGGRCHVFGIETEYGISALAPGSPALAGALSTGYVDDDLHPMQLSNHVVKAYGTLGGRTARRLGLRDRDPAPRHPRLRDLPGRPPTRTS